MKWVEVLISSLSEEYKRLHISRIFEILKEVIFFNNSPAFLLRPVTLSISAKRSLKLLMVGTFFNDFWIFLVIIKSIELCFSI